MKLPNRDKIINELTRRYEEVLRRSESRLKNDEDARQFISLIAHYINYIKQDELTEEAITKLFKNKEALASDQVLIDEADKIIVQLRKDRNKVVKFAAKQGIDTGPYQFNTSSTAQQITLDKEVSFNLSFLDNFLKLPSDHQRVSDLPNQIGHFRSIIFATTQLAGETRALTKLKSDYSDISNEFAKKLKMQGVYLNYLRIEDYQALEVVWREVYQESDHDEQFIFHFMYGDLFEKNRTFSPGQQNDANEFVSKYMSHLQRVHNYLIDGLENAPSSEKFVKWLVEHFGPTLASVIIILVIYVILRHLGLKIDINSLKNWVG
ncbi:MAG TPA: hypothetical protein VFT49_01480 [Candidatus Saccharimonadales bacterium]|nr:hypothetical protein [Candidatus Saccharimonadales bacterium]